MNSLRLILFGLSLILLMENILAQDIISINSSLSKEYPERMYQIDPQPLLREIDEKYGIDYSKAEPANRLAKIAAWNFTVGSAKAWWASNFVTNEFYQVSSTCRAVGTNCYIFVEDAIWGTKVDLAAVNSVKNAFDVSTPANPSKGVYQTNVETFGNPPDVDSDPKIVILILDINDGYVSGSNGGYVAGYFHSVNEITDVHSNRAEIYYLDANPTALDTPGGITTAMSTTAHEFQHMIHYNYHKNGAETFFNEGMSLIAEYVNGYDLREQSRYSKETNHYLLDWRSNDNTAVLIDYSRAARFAAYMYDQYGLAFLKSYVQSASTGISAMTSILSSYSAGSRNFSSFLEDWLIANTINDITQNSGRWGYKSFPSMTAAVASEYTNPKTGLVSSGISKYGAQYLTFTSGSNLSMSLDFKGNSLKAYAVKYKTLGGSPEVELVSNPSSYSVPAFGTTYNKITFIVLQSDQNAFISSPETNTFSYTYQATGIFQGGAVELAYDTGNPEYAQVQNLVAGDTVCVFFDSPLVGAKIDSIKVALRQAGTLIGGVYEYTGVQRPTPLGKKLASVTATSTIAQRPTSPYPVPWPNWVKIDLRQYNIDAGKSIAVAFTMNGTYAGDGSGDNRVMVECKTGTSPDHSYTYLSQSTSGSGWYYISDSESGSIFVYLIRAYASYADYSVETSSSPPEGGNTTGGGSYNSGENVTVTATPNSGYIFNNWTDNGAVVSTSANYSFTISANRNLVANFSKITYSVVLSASPSNGGTISGVGTYNSGSLVTVIASPYPGYTFRNWTENGVVVSTSASYSFTISSNKNMIANFAGLLAYYPFNGNATDESGNGNNGTIYGSTSTTDRFGSPNSAFSFNGSNNYINVANNSLLQLSGNEFTLSVWATHAGINNIDKNLLVKSDGIGSSPYKWIFWYKASVNTPKGIGICRNQTMIGYNNVPVINAWYHYVAVKSSDRVKIYINNTIVLDTLWSYSNPSTTADLRIGGQEINGGGQWWWGKLDDIRIYNKALTTSEINSLYHENGWQIYTIQTSSNPSNGGSTSGGGTYNSGASVTVTATPNSGYTFSNWTENGSVVSTNASYTFTISGNRTLVANFSKTTYAVTLNSNPTAGGSASGGGTFNSGASVTVTASPNSGYTFSNWTENGSVVSTNASYTFTISANRNLVANFLGLVAYYPFNGNANDASGNDNNGTVYGATLTADRFGTSNKAYSFNGSTNYIRVPYSNSLGVQKGITLSAWVYMQGGTDAATPPRVLELRGYYYGAGGDAGYAMIARSNSNVSRNFEVRYFNNYGNSNITIYPTSSVPALEWHHLVFTADGITGSGKFYVDGALLNTITGDIITSCDYNNNALYIGAESNLLGMWGGKLDEIRIYNRALSDSEILLLYQDGNYQQFIITTSANPSNGGSTSGGDTYNSGASVTVTATPNPGYTFSNWTENGFVVSTNASYTFTISANRNLVANFIENSQSVNIKPQTVATTIPKGTSFWVDIKVGDPKVVTDLYGISFRINSSNSYCTYVDGSAKQGDFLGSSVLTLPQKIDNQTVDMAITKLSAPGVNGSGIVASLQFISSSNITSDQTVLFSLSNLTANDSKGDNILLTADTLSVTIQAITTVNVWPGDANNDGLVNSADLLPIGLYYGQFNGTNDGVPNSPGISWQAYTRQTWALDGNTPKRIYIDANGDGKINATDLLAIGINYGKEHSISGLFIDNKNLSKTLTNPSIKIVTPEKEKSNINFTVQVTVGEPVAVTDLYGISFRLKSGSPTCKFVENSAMEGGFLNNGTIKLFQMIDEQTIDAAISKTSAPGVNGNGLIATFNFVSSLDQTVQFHLSNIMAIDSQGNTIDLDAMDSSILVDVKIGDIIPSEYRLSLNYPNPFNPTTKITYQLPERSNVILKVYNALGKELRTLVNSIKEAGSYFIDFDASDLPSGLYIYKIQAGNYIQSRKMLLLK